MSFAFDAATALVAARRGVATVATFATVAGSEPQRACDSRDNCDSPGQNTSPPAATVAESQQSQGVAGRQDENDAFDERAAICEYDGGLQREQAESLAALHAMPLPAGVNENHRAIVIDAAARFLDQRRRSR